MAKRWLSALSIWLLVATSVRAHGLGVAWKFDKANGTVEVSAFFNDDSPAASAGVRVTSFLAGDEIAAGRTDPRGNWSFPIPKPGRYRIEVNAGDGHRSRVDFNVSVDPAGVAIDDGPSREEFTRFPWGRLGIGLAIIAAAAVAAKRWYPRRGDELPSLSK